MPLTYFRRPVALATASCILLLALLRSWGFFRAVPPGEWARFARFPRPEVLLEGTVASGFAETRYAERVRVRADRIGEVGPVRGGRGSAQPAEAADVLAYLPRGLADREALRPGQRVALSGTLRLPRRPRNPGDFDEAAWLADKGISFVFDARGLRIVRRGVPPRWWPAWTAEAAHRSMHRMLVEAYPTDLRPVLEGVVIGSHAPIDPGLGRAMREAGVVHLIVPSGTNAVFLMALCLWLSSRARLPRPWPFLVAASVCGLYGLLSGPEPPYLRAWLCVLIGQAGLALERESGGFQALVLSALALLAAWPRTLFQTGFQMSYLVVFGLLVSMPRWTPPGRWPAPVRWAWRVLSVSLVAQLMLCPILARDFGRIPLLGALANVLLVPLTGLMLAAGFATWAVYLVSGPFPWVFHAAAVPLGWMAEAFVRICFAFASIPWAGIEAGPLGPAAAAAYYLAVLGILVLPRWRASAVLWCSAAGVALAAALVPASAPSLQVIFLSWPGRQAAVVALPDGRRLILDAGLPAHALRRELRALGPGRIAAVLVTSADPAAWRGLAAAAEAGAEEILAAEGALRSERFRAALHALGPAGPRVGVLEPGFRREWAGVEVSAGPPVPGRGADPAAVPILLRFGEARLVYGDRPGTALLRGAWTRPFGPRPAFPGGDLEFCILLRLPGGAVPARRCAPERSLDARRDGAVWVRTNGKSHAVAGQRELHAHGRSFL